MLLTRPHYQYRILFLVPVVLAFHATPLVRADDALLKEVLQNNKATRESIRTFSASIIERTRESDTAPVKLTYSAKYWRSDDDVRIQESFPNGTAADQYIIGSEGRTISHRVMSGKTKYHCVRYARSALNCTGDVWRAMSVHFIFLRTGGGCVPVEELLAVAKSTPNVKAVNDKGQTLLMIELEYEDQGVRGPYPVRLTVWFNRDRNYHVQKVLQTYGPNLDSKFEFSVRDYIEYAPGRFFPIKADASHSYKGRAYAIYSLELQNVRVNQSIPRNTFRIPNPPRGTTLLDRITNMTYPINENWERIGPAKPHTVVSVPSSAPLGAETYTSQTTEEPTRHNWLLLGSLFVIAVGVGIGIYRRVRPRWGPARRAR